MTTIYQSDKLGAAPADDTLRQLPIRPSLWKRRRPPHFSDLARYPCLVCYQDKSRHGSASVDARCVLSRRPRLMRCHLAARTASL
jgi:hypothetical protein